MSKIRCYECGRVFDEKDLIYTKDPDELQCPLCLAIELGFSEVKDDE
jgi:rubredoxin